jgi:hypothetical protein
MSILYASQGDTETGMVVLITDTPCTTPDCGWSETYIHLERNGDAERGCPVCETTWPVEGDLR